MSRTRALLTAAITLSALAVGGCTDDDPDPKPSPPTSSAPTSAADPVEPTMPTEARRRTNSGAEAFVQYWVRLVNYAQATGDTQRLEGSAHPQCVGCAGLVKTIRDAYKSGGHIEGGTWVISRLRELPLDFGAEWAAYAEAKTSPQAVVAPDGSGTSFDGGSFGLYVYVDWQSGWRMRWLRTPA